MAADGRRNSAGWGAGISIFRLGRLDIVEVGRLSAGRKEELFKWFSFLVLLLAGLD